MIPPKTKYTAVTATDKPRSSWPIHRPAPPLATPHTRAWNSTSSGIGEPYYLRFRQIKNEVKQYPSSPRTTHHSPHATRHSPVFR